jgi:cytochrome c oxidase subunit 2
VAVSGKALATASLLLALTACSGEQAVLAPRGPAGDVLARFSWQLFAGGAAIFVGTMAMFAVGLFMPERTKGTAPIKLIIFGGVVFPIVVLAGLSIYTALVGGWVDLGRTAKANAVQPLQINVDGVMWWWKVEYPLADGGSVKSANEIHVPVGHPVEIHLTTQDVIHSFWVPTLHGKMDLIPGRTNRITIQMDEPGVVRGQCAEFCGLQHTLMSFWVVAHPPDEFDAWMEAQRLPAVEPGTPELARGRDAFLASGCGSCHRVRGLEEGETKAGGEIGPDLTHIGSRLSLGAAALPNGVGPLSGWIAGSQQIKPGNRMPSYHHLDGDILTALAGYLESLK